MSEKKRKSKTFYKKMAKLSRQDGGGNVVDLSSGLRGFLITCNFNEYNCLKDSYFILNDISDRIYGPNDNSCDNDNDNNKGDEEESIEKSIEAELATLKSTKERRFHQVKTKCQNVIFIKTNDSKVIPGEVVEQLFKDIKTNLVMNSRYIQRFLPVNITFKAKKEVFFDRFTELFDELATKDAKKFSVLVKVRFNNDHPSESSLKEACIKIIKDKRSNWIVRHDNPEILIGINICIKAACLSLLDNYDNLSKYNPGEYLKKLANNNETLENEAKPIEIESQNDIPTTTTATTEPETTIEEAKS